MSGIGEILENPTISKVTRQEKKKYQMSHINVMDLLKRIDILEKQSREYKKSESELKKEISTNKNEIKSLKSKCLNLEQQTKENNKSEELLLQIISEHENEINRLKTVLSISEQRKTVEIGKIIKFGKYEGKEIEWQVLDINKSDNSVLLISKYLLFKKAYNDKREGCTWETSTLRKYLNSDFYINTFNEEEKKKINEKLIKNQDNKRFGINGGNDTRDKIFLLNIVEINKYFKTDNERQTFADEIPEWYWLRSPGYDTDFAAYVSNGGRVYGDGYYVEDDNMGVRPALWVNL